MASPLAMLDLFFIFLLAPKYSLAYESRNHEVVALIAVKNSLVDSHGVMSDWDEYSVDPCSWSMITCSPDNIVVGLGAPSQHLAGTLSPAIANLTNIRQILLQNNNISGEMPRELTSLSMLQTLDLSNNSFFNSLPSSFSRLRNLQYLRLNNNSFSGPFPASLADLSQLSFLDISFNNLTGPVPYIQAKTFNMAGNPLICAANAANCYPQQEALPFPFTLAPSPGKNKLGIALGASAGAVFGCLIIAGVAWYVIRKRSPSVLNISCQEDEEIPKLGNLRSFTFRDLQHATENFTCKNLLGAGGFGNVYKGKLKDGTIVAVKRLKDVSGTSGDSQFKTEVEMISLAVHRNLLRLVGFCASSNEKLLVYPYMSNGSVANRLRVKPALDWGTRKRIAIGAARGLVYLHDQCDPKIIHRDVKAANVLLDEDYEAVVGDFGLAKLLDHADSHVTTAVRGTVGHIAPEYLSTGQSSEKTDVFGFGILVVELVSGMRALDLAKSAGQKGAVLDWLKRMDEEMRLHQVVDKGMCGNYDKVEVREMLQVALLCTQYLPAHRPKMCEVLRMLEGDGLPHKWLSSHGLVADFHRVSSLKHCGYGSGSCVGSSVSADDDDDDQTLHAYTMELSGPR